MYSFILKQIALEPIDVLSARLRDQAEHIKTLESAIEAMKPGYHRSSEPVYVQGITTECRGNGHKLVWKHESGDVNAGQPWPVYFAPNGKITVSKTCVYAIHVVVHVINNSSGAAIQLHQNQKSVASTTLNVRNGHVASMPLHRVLALGLEDELAVVYTGTNRCTSGSSLVMYQLR